MKVDGESLIIESFKEHQDFIKYCAYFAPETGVNIQHVSWVFREEENETRLFYPAAYSDHRYVTAAKEFIKINKNES